MVPDRIGRYEVRAVAGSGGFATVFEGYDPRLEARVAIKVLADNKSRIPEIRHRFGQEAVLLRRMRTEQGVPGLIEVFDVDETDTGQPFFVMGWADRGTIAQRRGTAPWSADAVFPLIRSLTQSLGHLHAAGVVHRDIKPQKLLLRSDRGAEPPAVGRVVEGERILVGDLGLAKDLADGSSSMSLIGGTERYMAPEQLVYGGSVDHRADIFAATRMIEELLQGPSQQRELSPGVRAVLQRGSAQDRDDRHATMSDWQDDLLGALFPVEPSTDVRGLVAEAVAAQPDPSAEAQRGQGSPRRRTNGRVALALVVLVGLAAFAWLQVRSATSPIVGPDSIISGETAVYSVDPSADTSVSWIDPSGAPVLDDTLAVTGRLPGPVSFAALVDGERHERTVMVEPSERGPTIVGPTTVPTGSSGTFSATVDPDDWFYWIHPTEGTVVVDELTVEQLGESFVVGLIAVDPFGVERGQELQVQSG